MNNSDQLLSIDGLIFEQEKIDELMTFNKSLERLRNAGYERHLRPAEVFSIIIDYLENKENSKYFDLAKNVLSGNGEWMSCAFKKEKNLLHIAIDPENLVWDGKKYIINDGLAAGLVKSFNIGDKKSQEFIDLAAFPNKLVSHLYGRKFKDLPKEMREESYGAKMYKAKIYLPKEGIWFPIGSCCGNSCFSIHAQGYFGRSRGVREKF